MIGRGRQLDSLFVLQYASFLSLFPSLISHVTSDTWHARLGHLSNEVFSKVSPYISDYPLHFDHLKCSICPLAKLRRLSSQSHNNLSESTFDLVHCDIWGPYSVPTYNKMRYFFTIVDDYSHFT